MQHADLCAFAYLCAFASVSYPLFLCWQFHPRNCLHSLLRQEMEEFPAEHSSFSAGNEQSSRYNSGCSLSISQESLHSGRSPSLLSGVPASNSGVGDSDILKLIRHCKMLLNDQIADISTGKLDAKVSVPAEIVEAVGRVYRGLEHVFKIEERLTLKQDEWVELLTMAKYCLVSARQQVTAAASFSIGRHSNIQCIVDRHIFLGQYKFWVSALRSSSHTYRPWHRATTKSRLAVNTQCMAMRTARTLPSCTNWPGKVSML